MAIPAAATLAAQSIRSRSVQWTTGSVRTREGLPAVVVTDVTSPEPAVDAPAARGARTWVLATSGEATDTNIIRPFWDLSRADAGIVPILGNHEVEEHAGTWRNVRVEGAELLAEDDFDVAEDIGAYWAGKVDRGYIKTCSVGWIPGELTLRGDLDPADPLYREPITDECGERVEGYVMGSEQHPNVLIEASMTPVPADPNAQARHARLDTAGRQVAALARGERVSGVDLAGALLALRDRSGVRNFIREQVRALLLEEPQLVRDLLNPAAAASARPFADLFPKG